MIICNEIYDATAFAKLYKVGIVLSQEGGAKVFLQMVTCVVEMCTHRIPRKYFSSTRKTAVSSAIATEVSCRL